MRPAAAKSDLGGASLVAGGWWLAHSYQHRMVHTVDTVTTSYMLRSEDWGWGVSAVKNMIAVATSIQIQQQNSEP